MSRLPGPTMDQVPGNKPAAGITRPDLEESTWSKVDKPSLTNSGMDLDYPTEGRRRGVNGPNNRS